MSNHKSKQIEKNQINSLRFESTVSTDRDAVRQQNDEAIWIPNSRTLWWLLLLMLAAANAFAMRQFKGEKPITNAASKKQN